MRLHHVQVALPTGGEPEPRRFYVEGLRLREVEKPEPLRSRSARPGRLKRETFLGHVRCHTFDGHGNRVELLARPE